MNNKKQKIYRVVDGALWKWETNGSFVRAIRVNKIKNVESIDYYAEKLIKYILKNSKQVVYNLK